MIELLAAIAVLVILGVLVTQIIGATSRTTRLSNRKINAATQARLIFDRMGLDLANLATRFDTDFYAQDSRNPQDPNYSGELQLLFPSITLSPEGDRILSLVAYKIAPHNDTDNRPALLRAGNPVSWSSGSILGLHPNMEPVRFSNSDSAFDSTLLPGTTDFDIVGPGVLAMQIGYQLRADHLPVQLKDGSSLTAEGQVVYSPPVRSFASGAFIDLNRVGSLIVGIAALDADNLNLLSPSEISAISAKFDTPDNGKLPVEAWTPVISQLIATGAGPLPARQSLRVYQRAFRINPTL